ncbi:MAG: hypothetical protein R3346_01630 [Candidatus Spechtbacterales bacterium]|nr:hypothetical protein [Candidatus Spechtbacterales bacterium]
MKKLSLILILVLFLIPSAQFADAASFGVTPPYVKNNTLARGSVYQQEITLVRGNPDVGLQTKITWDVPGANDWISIDKGTEFIMPEGEQKVPLKITVNVPLDADFKNYSGDMRIATTSLADIEDTAGSVRIALGARINVDFTVIDREIHDFDVRRIRVDDLNQYRTWRWLTYPGKVNFTITIANTGNVPVAPDKVTFDIYDIKNETFLESTENTNKLNKIEPFQEGQVIAELPTFLPSGSYLAHYKIYLGDEVKQEGEINLSILPESTLASSGYGFMGLTLFDKFTIMGPISILIASFLLLYREQLFTEKTAFGRGLRKAIATPYSKIKNTEPQD